MGAHCLTAATAHPLLCCREGYLNALGLGCHPKNESIAKTWQIIVPALAAQRLPERVYAYGHPVH